MIRSWFFACLLALFWGTGATAQVTLDMRDANLRNFVQLVAENTGRNFILDPRVQGTVTVIAPSGVSPQALYEIFLNVLELNRLTIVQGTEADRIVPLDLARELAPGSRVDGLGGAYETRVVRINNVPVTEVVEVIRPLLPPEAVLSAVPESGLIILSDRSENFRRITSLIRSLDRPRESSIETIRIVNGNAADLLQVVQGLDIAPAGASMSADTRANALIVSGSADFRSRVRAVVSQLDTPQRSVSTRVVQLNYADAKELEAVVQQSFGGTTGPEGTPSSTKIVAEPRQNALIVTAPSDQITSIVQSIRALDMRPSQVLIEALVFELSVETYSDLSVQFGAILNDAVAGGVEYSLEGRPTLTGLISSLSSSTAASAGSGAVLGGRIQPAPGFGFAGFIAALASDTSTRLLSTPSILTLNNQQAEIVVAQNVPFLTGSFATVGDSAVPEQPFQTIQRQDVGLTLQVTPQITADGTVRLAIRQEVSNLTNAAAATGGEITARRLLTTNVLVRDSHVIVLGGLIEDGSGAVTQRVPGLSTLPILGQLFRGRNVSRNQRVLLVMLRPQVISNDREATRISREIARETRAITRAIEPGQDGYYPAIPGGAFPFDGANLDQPFDAGFVDPISTEKLFPPLPSRLQFNAQ